MRKDDPTEGIPGSSCQRVKAITPGPMKKSHNTALIGRWHSAAACFGFALETARGAVRLFGSARSTSRMGVSVSSAPTAAKTLIFRCRRELQAACDAMPKAHLTYIVTAYGKPRSKYGLGNDFAKWATEAGLPALVACTGSRRAGCAGLPRRAAQRMS